jgi:hypothetical protein
MGGRHLWMAIDVDQGPALSMFTVLERDQQSTRERRGTISFEESRE